MSAAPHGAELERDAVVEIVRSVLSQLGGLYPAVTDDAPVNRLPGVDEPWLTVSEAGLEITLLVADTALPALPRLLSARRRLIGLLDVDVELIVADVVTAGPGAEDGAPGSAADRRLG